MAVSKDPLERVILPDGRALSYLDEGDPSGAVVFNFEGSPGHMRLRTRDAQAARVAPARIITVHRPGYRGSDPKPRRRLKDWPADVAVVADALSIPRFAVMGHSAGGPPALACAWGLPDRVTRAGIASGSAPLGFPGDTRGMSKDIAALYRLGRRAPFIIGPALRWFANKVRKDPAASIAASIRNAPSSEQRLYDDEFTALLVEASAHQANAGAPGLIGDIKALLAPWGFNLTDIRTPVDLWYGELDHASPAHGRRLAELLPNCELHLFPNEAHEVFYTHFPEVLAAVLA